jgi:hypothetical protein
MKLAIVVWVPFLVSALSAQVAPYNSSERAQLVLAEARSLETDIKTIRPKLFQNLDRHEAEIVAPIEFEVPDGHNLHSDSLNDCYAFRDPFGTPKVHIGLAFARGLHMFIDAQLLSRAMNKPDLGNKYVNYVLAGWAENLRLQQQNLAPRAIESPYTYFDAPRTVRDQIEGPSSRLYGAALAFAMAHEVGHHVLGHTVASKTQSAENEMKADAWAMQTLVGSGEPPAGGFLILGYWGALYDADSATATHPSAKDRGVAMIRSTLDNLDRFADRASSNGISIESVRKELEAALSQLGESGSQPTGDVGNNGLVKALRGVLQAVRTGGPSLPGSLDIDSNTSLRCVERSHLTCSRSFRDSEKAREVYQSLSQALISINRDCRNDTDNDSDTVSSIFCHSDEGADVMLSLRGSSSTRLEVSVSFFRPNR